MKTREFIHEHAPRECAGAAGGQTESTKNSCPIHESNERRVPRAGMPLARRAPDVVSSGCRLHRDPLPFEPVVGSMHRIDRGRYDIRFEALNEPGEKLPTGELTERYARALERDIRNDPAGWWWSHKRWKLVRPQ